MRRPNLTTSAAVVAVLQGLLGIFLAATGLGLPIPAGLAYVDGLLFIGLGVFVWKARLWAAYTLVLVSALSFALTRLDGQAGWIIPPLLYVAGAVALHKAHRRPIPERQETPMTMKVFALAAMTLAIATNSVPAQENLTGRQWMQFDADQRAYYIMGYWDTLRHVTRALGGDFVIKQPMTYQQAAEIIYRKLVQEPELRSGPLQDIATAALQPFLTLTDRQGRPFDTSKGATK